MFDLKTNEQQLDKAMDIVIAALDLTDERPMEIVQMMSAEEVGQHE